MQLFPPMSLQYDVVADKSFLFVFSIFLHFLLYFSFSFLNQPTFFILFIFVSPFVSVFSISI